jgi:hypothetical protein
MIIIILLLLSLLTVFFYGIILGATSIVSKSTKSNKVFSRKIIFLSSFLLSCLTFCFFLFSTPATNYKTAFIEQQKQFYKVTVKGKRVLMAHDPVSALLRKTYEDSIVFIVPRNHGIIQGDEIQVLPDSFKPIGAITIQERQMTIKLYYDDKETEPNSWNGKFTLSFR